MRLLFLLLFPALELYLLVKAGGAVGALNVVLWVFASALIGLWAVRVQGQGAMLKVQEALAAGQVPQQTFTEGLLLFLAGVLLILPGIITDTGGLLLLVPPFRRYAASALGKYLASRRPQSANMHAHSRVFFFRSSFPGGGSMGRKPEEHPYSERVQGPVYRDNGDDEPRQAVIIESTAIEVQKEKDTDAGNGKSGPAKP